MTQLYTKAQAAERLQVSERWLEKRVTARRIPHTWLGRHIRFSDQDLAEIAAMGHRDPVTPPRAQKKAPR